MQLGLFTYSTTYLLFAINKTTTKRHLNNYNLDLFKIFMKPWFSETNNLYGCLSKQVIRPSPSEIQCKHISICKWPTWNSVVEISDFGVKININCNWWKVEVLKIANLGVVLLPTATNITVTKVKEAFYKGID